MNLVQLHWQWIENGKTVKTEMRSQRDRDKMKNHKEFREWVRKIVRDHPVPLGAIWMACEETSKHFTKTRAGENNA